MRNDNWLVQYHKTMDAIAPVPFSWQEHDCLHGLVVPVLKALTGKDYFKKYNKYKTAAGALKTMRKAGFDNLADLAASELPEIGMHEVVTGDIVAIPTDDEFGFSLGVADGDRAFVMHEASLGTRSINEATRAFKV